MRLETTTGDIAQRTRAGAYLALTKPRVMELLLVTTVPMMFLAERGVPNLWLVGATLIGGALSAAAASSFNMYLDRDIDAKMDRTSTRPLVTGEITPRAALIFSWTLASVSCIWLWLLVNPTASLLSAFAMFFYVVIYTMVLKRRTVQNIVWGGAAGCFPVLIGWTAVTGTLAWTPFVMFAVVFFWTPAHYWPLSIRYSDDYRRAAVPMLGAVRPPSEVAAYVLGYAIATVFCSLALVPIAGMGLTYAVVSTVGGAWFVVEAILLLRAERRRASTPRPMRVFHASNAYLSILFVTIALDPLITTWAL